MVFPFALLRDVARLQALTQLGSTPWGLSYIVQDLFFFFYFKVLCTKIVEAKMVLPSVARFGTIETSDNLVAKF